MSKGSVAKTVGIWIVTGLAALGFLLAGSSKFTSDEMWMQRFEGWGYPTGFSYVIGFLEATGAIGLLVPLASAYAALALGVIMVGALLTHVLSSESFNGPVIYLVLLGIILRVRWSTRWRP